MTYSERLPLVLRRFSHEALVQLVCRIWHCLWKTDGNMVPADADIIEAEIREVFNTESLIPTTLFRDVPDNNTLLILTIRHEYGVSVYPCRTQDEIQQRLKEYVEAWWAKELKNAPMPAVTEDMITAYFKNCGDYSI